MAKALLVAALFVAILPGGAGAGAPTEAGWYRISFDRKITPGDRRFLDRTGIDSLYYSPDNAYVAWVEPGRHGTLRSRPSIDSVTPVRPMAKIGRSLRLGEDHKLTVIARVSAVHWSSLGDVLGTPYAFTGDGKIQAAVFPALPSTLSQAMSDPAVLYVGPASTGLVAEDESSAQIAAGNLSSNNVPQLGYETFLGTLGLDGSGVTISINDDGIDDTHPEFEGRVAQRFDYGPGGNRPSGGHGTHVAGIAAGIGVELPGAGRSKDADGFLYGMGIAPGATLIDQPTIAIATGDVADPVELRSYAADAVNAGAVAWNASWHSGEGTGAGYIANAALLDDLARDADEGAAGNQQFTFVFSAGNGASNGSPMTITSPKEAKNIISVGNSGSARSTSVPIDGLAGSSSRGPAVDGRILPTVAAPGSTIVSANSLTGDTCDGGVGTYLPFYTTCSGTSMAAPHVTGTVALIHEWWRSNNNGADSSPAMDKALLVNSAYDMGASDIPNNNEGWGRIHLGRLFDPATERVMIDQTAILGGVGDSFSIDVEPADLSKPVKATLVWTDPPGIPGGTKALVNDLDLTVQASDGTFWFGNDFADGWSTANFKRDDLNNAENVFLQSASAGSYRVKVDAVNLPGDGIPGNESPTDQDFALVLSNVREAAAGTFPEGLPQPAGTVEGGGGPVEPPAEPVVLHTDEATILGSNPLAGDLETSVTDLPFFLLTCPDAPPTQDVDAHVFTLPSTAGKDWTAAVEGSDLTGGFDLDYMFYSDNCDFLGYFGTSEPNEVSEIPIGTKFVEVVSWLGVGVDVDLTISGPPTQ